MAGWRQCCESGSFLHPGSGSVTLNWQKNFSIFDPINCCYSLGNMIRDVFIPDPEARIRIFFPFRITDLDPESRGQKAIVADPGSGGFFDPWIRDRFLADPGSPTHILKAKWQFWGKKYFNSVSNWLKFFSVSKINQFCEICGCCWIRDSRFGDPEWIKIRIRVKHPGFATLKKHWILDPGSAILKKALDPGSRIHNTGWRLGRWFRLWCFYNQNVV